MGSSSKDLLRFEYESSSTSPLESSVLVCKKKDSASQTHKPDPVKKPTIAPFPKSQVLGKVKDFLGVMAEANKRLELDAKNNPQAYDIEVLNEKNDSEVIEMDLMLGVADLQTPEALAAAESSIAGNQPAITISSSSSGTESDESDNNEESDDDGNDDNETSCHRKLEKSNMGKDNAASEAAGKSRSKKRARIVELS